ncbi:hypothetical protein BD414DRAFT_217478 [Trametes punicea]|nr:hypothetical protein BD414DRAFT_217478 [Trametes punicea]
MRSLTPRRHRARPPDRRTRPRNLSPSGQLSPSSSARQRSRSSSHLSTDSHKPSMAVRVHCICLHPVRVTVAVRPLPSVAVTRSDSAMPLRLTHGRLHQSRTAATHGVNGTCAPQLDQHGRQHTRLHGLIIHQPQGKALSFRSVHVRDAVCRQPGISIDVGALARNSTAQCQFSPSWPSQG